jgi:hypothetical protein
VLPLTQEKISGVGKEHLVDCPVLIDNALTNLSDMGLVLILILGVGTVLMAIYNDFELDNPIVTLFALCVSVPVFLLFAGSLQEAMCGGMGAWSLVVLSSLALLTYLWVITRLVKIL